MTIAVILILGILWIAVLVPPILRARGEQGRSDSVGDFHHRLSALGSTNGHRERSSRHSGSKAIFIPTGMGPTSMSAAQRRRRDVLVGLVAVCVVSLFAALLTRSTAVFAFQIIADLALGGYLYLLVQHKHRTQVRARPRVMGPMRVEPMSYFAPDYVGRTAQSGPRLVPLRQTASR